MSKQKKAGDAGQRQRPRHARNRAQGRRKPPGSSRNAPSSGGGSRRVRLIALVVVLVLAVAGGAWALTRAATGCRGRLQRPRGRGPAPTRPSRRPARTSTHLAGRDRPKYNSNPPTHRAALPDAGALGHLRRARPAGAARAQPRARRRSSCSTATTCRRRQRRGAARRRARRPRLHGARAVPEARRQDRATRRGRHLVECTGFRARLSTAKARWRNQGPESPIDPNAGRLPNW